ncbi:MAG: hypothetical protein NTV23_11955 [Propionibacteriales bacterium]|nr:hypothetical protein [Propionibacteriales bacterium]
MARDIPTYSYETRKKYRDIRPDPEGFLSGTFTLAELRTVHEAVLSAELPKDAFNRRMEPLLEPVRRRDGSPVYGSGVGRPARVYRRKRARA